MYVCMYIFSILAQTIAFLGFFCKPYLARIKFICHIRRWKGLDAKHLIRKTWLKP